MLSTETHVKKGFQLRTDLHIARKIWHMSAGLIGLFVYLRTGVDQRSFAYALLGVAIAGLIVELARLNIAAVNRFVTAIMRPVMRDSEKDSMSGLPFYALGASLSLFFFDERVAILSILFLIFSDPISSYFGILYGKDKILPNKSLQGSIAGFVCCYFITLLYGTSFGASSSDLFFFAVLAGIVGSVSELLSVIVDDNLTIPVASGIGLTLVNFLFPIF